MFVIPCQARDFFDKNLTKYKIVVELYENKGIKMKLLRDQVAVVILEMLNNDFNLQIKKISINDGTNVKETLDLDDMDSQFFAWDLNLLFNINIPENKEKNLLNTSFSRLVDYIYNLNPTVSTCTREQIYWNDLPMNDPDFLRHIDGVLSGRTNPVYTLSTYDDCDKSEWHERFQELWHERFQELIEWQQECEEMARLEEAKRRAKDSEELLAHVKQKNKEERKRRIIIAITIALVIGVSIAGHYTVKKRKQNPKQTSELFQQTKKEAFIKYPIQKTK